MNELYLVHPIRTHKETKSTFKEAGGQSWRREANGDYVLSIEGETDDFVIPSTGVKYEKRSRPAGKR
jgi:hypothetical protein